MVWDVNTDLQTTAPEQLIPNATAPAPNFAQALVSPPGGSVSMKSTTHTPAAGMDGFLQQLMTKMTTSNQVTEQPQSFSQNLADNLIAFLGTVGRDKSFADSMGGIKGQRLAEEQLKMEKDKLNFEKQAALGKMVMDKVTVEAQRGNKDAAVMDNIMKAYTDKITDPNKKLVAAAIIGKALDEKYPDDNLGRPQEAYQVAGQALAASGIDFGGDAGTEYQPVKVESGDRDVVLSFDKSTGKPVVSYTGDPNTKGPLVSNVNKVGETIDKEIGKENIGYRKETYAALDQAQVSLSKVNNLEAVLEKVPYDKFQTSQTFTDIANMWGSITGKEYTVASDTEVARKQIADILIDERRRMQGQGQLTEKEQEAIRDALVRMDNSPAARKLIIGMMREQITRRQSMYEYILDKIGDRPSTNVLEQQYAREWQKQQDWYNNTSYVSPLIAKFDEAKKQDEKDLADWNRIMSIPPTQFTPEDTDIFRRLRGTYSKFK